MPFRVFWDLDGVQLDTDTLVAAVLSAASQSAGKTVGDARAAMEVANRQGFTWELFLKELGVPVPLWAELIGRFDRHFTTRASEHVFEGVFDALYELGGAGAHQVLVTRGVPAFQQRKFDGMHTVVPFFDPGCRHFVPSGESKGAVIARYGPVTMPAFFVDDSTEMLNDVREAAPHVKLVRAAWAPSAPAECPDDFVSWYPAFSPRQALAFILEHGAAT